MLGALLGFGIQPGPRLYQTNPEIFWSVIMSMYIGMVVLLILNLPLIPYIARVLATPRTFLIPLILFFSLTGVYLMSFNNFDIYMMIGIAVVALQWIFAYMIFMYNATINSSFCIRRFNGRKFKKVFTYK